MNAGPTTTRQVFYTGRVQGVGFRYRTADVAKHYPVNGYVRNLDDGRVELVAAGQNAEISRFLAAVAAAMADNIDHVDLHEFTTAETYSGFTIRS